MSNYSSHIYTAQDFERYWNGDMPFADRHNLEKAALADPFLNDALEGYRYAANHAGNDVSHLQKKLNKKITQSSTTSVANSYKSWIRIAALVLLIAGVGWGIYTFSFSKKDSEIAQNKEQVANTEATVDSNSPNKRVEDLTKPAQKKDGATDPVTEPAGHKNETEANIKKQVDEALKPSNDLQALQKAEEVAPRADDNATAEPKVLQETREKEKIEAKQERSIVETAAPPAIAHVDKAAPVPQPTQPAPRKAMTGAVKDMPASITILSADKAVSPVKGWRQFEATVINTMNGNSLLKSSCEAVASLTTNEKGVVVQVEINKVTCEHVEPASLKKSLLNAGNWNVTKASVIELRLRF